jgi:hypothetical protein
MDEVCCFENCERGCSGITAMTGDGSELRHGKLLTWIPEQEEEEDIFCGLVAEQAFVRQVKRNINRWSILDSVSYTGRRQ